MNLTIRFASGRPTITLLWPSHPVHSKILRRILAAIERECGDIAEVELS